MTSNDVARRSEIEGSLLTSLGVKCEGGFCPGQHGTLPEPTSGVLLWQVTLCDETFEFAVPMYHDRSVRDRHPVQKLVDEPKWNPVPNYAMMSTWVFKITSDLYNSNPEIDPLHLLPPCRLPIHPLSCLLIWALWRLQLSTQLQRFTVVRH